MKDTMRILRANADWIYRVLLFLLTAGLYWLQMNFIPRKEFVDAKEYMLKQYYDDKKTWWDELAKMTSTLKDLDISIRLLEINKGSITDHELRIRALEKELTSHEAEQVGRRGSRIDTLTVPNSTK